MSYIAPSWQPSLHYRELAKPRIVRDSRTGRPCILIGWWLAPSGARIGADILQRTSVMPQHIDEDCTIEQESPTCSTPPR